jgi:hypothetical protein
MSGNFELAYDAQLSQVDGTDAGDTYWLGEYSTTLIAGTGYDTVHINHAVSQCSLTKYSSGKLVIAVQGMPITYSLWGVNVDEAQCRRPSNPTPRASQEITWS